MLIVTAKEDAVTLGMQHADPEGTMARQGSSMEAALCLCAACPVLDPVHTCVCTHICADMNERGGFSSLLVVEEIQIH